MYRRLYPEPASQGLFPPHSNTQGQTYLHHDEYVRGLDGFVARPASS